MTVSKVMSSWNGVFLGWTVEGGHVNYFTKFEAAVLYASDMAICKNLACLISGK